MALLEINLKKPSLMSERKTAEQSSKKPKDASDATDETTIDVDTETDETTAKRSRVKPALGLLVTALVATLVGRKVRARRKAKGGTEETEEWEGASSETAETEPAETKSSSGRRRKAAGAVGGLLAIAFLASRLRKLGSN